ncbi:MAG: NUDIX hydrolase [Oscillibacter sp.]|nr:NUDIX hydrolase [Oscillibacter sp.]
MNEQINPWLDWAVELQALAQAGLQYSKDPFDRERFQQVRDIAAKMMARKTGLSLEKVKDLFCSETGYQTPKLDTRAAVFQDGNILLVQENTGRWSLPGGWVDVNVSVLENVVKEVREEAGLEVIPQRVIAIQDREKHNRPVYAWKVCKIFVLCALAGGEFQPNIETTASAYFPLEALPPLAEEKNTEEQIRLCFEASRAAVWETRMD